VYRVFEDGRHEVVASDLGLACGLAFAPDGTMFVGDRSGTIFHIDPKGRTGTLTTLPASVAAFHLAMGPDDALYVTGPTLASYDRVYRVDLAGNSEALAETFGRPQGLAFDTHGVLHVVEALAGVSGVYRLPQSGPKSIAVSGARLVGLAFGANDTLVVASADTVWRFA
jgi:sugar lactone lactonase YvrE